MTDKNEVLRLAALAHLEFSESELDAVTKDMDEIIGFAGRINSACKKEYGAQTDGVSCEELRGDEAEISSDRERVLSCAETENGLFNVKGGIV